MSSDVALRRAPYLEAIETHARSRPVALNVPGHKRGAFADEAITRALGSALRLDVPPLVHGVDLGATPSPYEEAQALAAAAWGARRTWFLVNGASNANHAACLALAARGGEVIVQRNVHSSIIDGLVLTGLRPRFLTPPLDRRLEVAHCLTPEALAAALAVTPRPAGVIVTSPTYFGMCADVAGLARTAHAHDVPIVVDEAWGAHFRFSDELPVDAIAAGADLVVSSTHKMLGSLTQSAMLHLGPDSLLLEDDVARAVTLLESTSRSALLVASLDAARRRAVVHGRSLIARTLAAVGAVHERLRALPGVDVLDARMIGRDGIHDVDPLRVAVTLRSADGPAFAAAARERANVLLELVAPRVLVAALAIGESEEAIKPLASELAAWRSGDDARAPAPAPPPDDAAPILTPREAFFAPRERVPLRSAAGRVCVETLSVYPPGIPVVIAGEALSPATTDYLAAARDRGATIRGAADPSLATMLVASPREPASP